MSSNQCLALPVTVLLLAAMLPVHVIAQHGPDLIHSHERVISIVPYVGKGTAADPRRPQFAPLASELGSPNSGILAYYQEAADDGKRAIVVFVAKDRASLLPVLNAKGPGIAVFEKGKHSDAEIQAAMKAAKKDFDMQHFMLLVP